MSYMEEIRAYVNTGELRQDISSSGKLSPDATSLLVAMVRELCRSRKLRAEIKKETQFNPDRSVGA